MTDRLVTKAELDAAILLNRIEEHNIDLDRRVGYRRPSGDLVEIPIDFEMLRGIADFVLKFAHLTDERISVNVNAEVENRTTDPGFDRLMEGWNATIHTIPPEQTTKYWRQLFENQLHVSRVQAGVIANLVNLLSGELNHEPIVQPSGDDRVDPIDAGASPESPPTGSEDDSTQGGGGLGDTT